ncbi:hypothetical protein VKT23_010044 [Stygiomarasmius scandens]|uniref:Uncharacterized protein n=1 Tax=Marasmiellus scandens TaxID=2682957 RepID=A0ABR1JCU5_9AGAR
MHGLTKTGDFLYGGRAIVYALLAAFDPAFIHGGQILLQHLREQWWCKPQPLSSRKAHLSDFSKKVNRKSCDTNYSSPGPVVHIELSKIVHHDFEHGQPANGSNSDKGNSQHKDLNKSQVADILEVNESNDNGYSIYQNIKQPVITFSDISPGNGFNNDVEMLEHNKSTEQGKAEGNILKQKESNRQQEEKAVEGDLFWKNI